MKRTNIIGALCCAGLAWAVFGTGSGAGMVTALYTGDGAAATATVPGENEGTELHPVACGGRIALATRKASTSQARRRKKKSKRAVLHQVREEEVVIPITPGTDVVKPIPPAKPTTRKGKKRAKDSTKKKL